jgi:hypothetical protein
VSLLATAAVFVAGVWLLLSGDAREYHAFGAVLAALAVAGLVVDVLIRARRRATGGPDRTTDRAPR